MRKIILSVAACLMFVCSFLLIVQPAGAVTVPITNGNGPVAWFQVDQNHVNVLEWDPFGSNNFAFGIYDWGVSEITSSNSLELFNGSESGFTGLSFLVAETFSGSGSYTATITGTSDSLDLTGGYLFGFYFMDSDGGYQTDYSFSGDTISDTFALSWKGITYLSVDANPVPIPTAILLLGSGLVGLVGFRRKRQNS